MKISKKYSSSLFKAIAVLNGFSPSEEHLGISDISRRTGLPKATVHRIVATLTKAQFLEQREGTDKYSIGPRVCILGSSYLNSMDLTSAAEPVIKAVSNLVNELVHVSILENGFIILLMKEEPEHAVRIATHIGSLLHAYASCQGKALLSELDESEIDRIYPEEKLKPLTKKTIGSKTELKAELEKIKETGIAYSKEQTFEGVEAVAAVIRDIRGKAIAATGISVPCHRTNQDYIDRLAKLVRLTANLISFRFGYHDSKNPALSIDEIRAWWKQYQVVQTTTESISVTSLD